MYIKDFDSSMFHKTKNKNKKYFCREKKIQKLFLQCLSSKNVLRKHEEVCLSINGTQFERFEKGRIECKI